MMCESFKREGASGVCVCGGECVCVYVCVCNRDKRCIKDLYENSLLYTLTKKPLFFKRACNKETLQEWVMLLLEAVDL